MVRPSRPVLKINPETNQVVQRFPSTASANLSLGLCYSSSSGIIYVCQGKRSTYRGYVWKYETEDYVHSLPVIATAVGSGEEYYSLSVNGSGRSLFGPGFSLIQHISKSCRTGDPYHGYIFRYEDDNNGFDHVEHPGAVKSIGTGQKQVLKVDRDTRGVIIKAAVSVLDRGKNIVAIQRGITMCCHNRRHTAYGYRWQFVPELIVTPPSDDEFDEK